MKLAGSVVVVTGGASGLGAATVRRLVAGGARAVIVDRDAAHGAALAAELGQTFVAADVTDAAQVEAAIAAAMAIGPLRVCVSCAGVGWAARTLDKTGKPHDLELFKTIIGVNLVGTFNVLRLAAEAMSQTEPLADGERRRTELTRHPQIIVRPAAVAPQRLPWRHMAEDGDPDGQRTPCGVAPEQLAAMPGRQVEQASRKAAQP